MSDDLVKRLRSHAEWGEAGPKANDGKLLKEAATALEEARAEIERRDAAYMRAVESRTEWRARAETAKSELSDLRDMLILCGELGGMGKDETPAAYLRRLIDEVASGESLRARVREVVGPFVSADLADCKDCIDNDGKHYQSQWLADALRAARQLMEEVK